MGIGVGVGFGEWGAFGNGGQDGGAKGMKCDEVS